MGNATGAAHYAAYADAAVAAEVYAALRSVIVNEEVCREVDALDGIEPPRRLSAPAPQQQAAEPTPPPAEQAPAQSQHRGPSAMGIYDGDPEPPPSDRDPGVD
jgi:hypothetical protein